MPLVRFPSRDGTELCGRLTEPSEPHGGVVVLCHPHPGHGGSMEAWMLPFLQRQLVEAGWMGLRFDFRGVGESAGSFDAGQREQEDVAGALDYLIGHLDGEPTTVLLGGWSFGAAVSLRHALSDDRLDGWFGVGLPHRTGIADVPVTEPDELTSWRTPKLLVHGTEDQFTPLERIRDLADQAGEPCELVVIEGGDHYLSGHRDQLGDAVAGFADTLLEGR